MRWLGEEGKAKKRKKRENVLPPAAVGENPLNADSPIEPTNRAIFIAANCFVAAAFFCS